MNFSIKIITVASFLSLSMAACQPALEECSDLTCGPSLEAAEAIGPGQEGGGDSSLRHFQLEIVGEGEVVVNGESCTTARGICALDVPTGTVIHLEGDFGFQSETGGDEQEGRCARPRGCRVLVGLDDLNVIADVEPDVDAGAKIERRPFGLLPGEPGIIIDDFPGQSSPARPSLNQGGQLSN